MKLELLLDREPIGAITEQTLSRVWTARYGTRYDVHWLPRGATLGNGHKPMQSWVCNAPLNVIFLPGSPRSQLEPIQREFGRSLDRWRQPLQSAYLRFALNPRLANMFRCATLGVTPPVPDGHNWIIIPGNQKLRLLNRAEGVCLIAVKHGFPSEPIQREMEVRAIAASLGLPVVPMLENSGDGNWYLERYICATPVNRLASREHATRVAARALTHLRRLVDATLEHRTAAEYADHLAEDLHALVETANLRERFGLDHIPDLIHRLVQITRRSTWPLPMAQTHGDFQPANILVDEDRFWLIDWELTRRRQAAYDPLVYFLAARFPRGLADRLQSVRETGPLAQAIAEHARSAYEWNEQGRRNACLAIFLLEELQWRLEQLAPSVMLATGGCIEQFSTEAHQWTRQQPIR